MSDTSPKDQNALLASHQPTPSPRQPKPRDCVFEFVRERDHVRWRCELVDDGPYGIDAQVLRNEEFSYSCRFPNRAFAEAWAELERRVPPRATRRRVADTYGSRLDRPPGRGSQ
jgi:hypothetical protein